MQQNMPLTKPYIDHSAQMGFDRRQELKMKQKASNNLQMTLLKDRFDTSLIEGKMETF